MTDEIVKQKPRRKAKTLEQYAEICQSVQAILDENDMRQAWAAAQEAGVSEKTVSDHLVRGTIPGVRAGNRWIVPHGVIEVALRAGVFTVGRGKYVRKPKKTKAKPQSGDGEQA